MARGKRGIRATVTAPVRGITRRVAASREIAQLRRDQRALCDRRTNGSLYAFYLPADDIDRRVLALRKGIPVDELPVSLTFNEARSMFGSLRDVPGTLRQIHAEEAEHGPERAPWTSRPRAAVAIDAAARAAWPGADVEQHARFAEAISVAFGLDFASRRPQLDPVSRYSFDLVGMGASGGDLHAFDAHLHEAQVALLADPDRATAYFDRKFSRAAPPQMAAVFARISTDSEVTTDHYGQMTVSTSAKAHAASLLAVALFERGATVGHTPKVQLEWALTENAALGGRAPVDAIGDDPKGNWAAVVAAAKAP